MENNEIQLNSIRSSASEVYQIWTQYKKDNYAPANYTDYIEEIFELVQLSDDLQLIRSSFLTFISDWTIVDKSPFTYEEIAKINDLNFKILNI